MQANGGIFAENEANRTVPLPGARSALALLLVINLFNYIDRQVLAAVLPNIQKTLFADDTENPKTLLGTLGMAFMVTYMLAAPVFGWLADRTSRWLLVGVGVILWSLASGASGLAATFTMLFLTRCFVGVGEAAYGPVAPTMISDLYPVRIRGRVLAWFYMAIPVGSALGYILGGQVIASTSDPEGWRWAFYLVVPPGILLGVLCFFMKEPGRGLADSGGLAKHGPQISAQPAASLPDRPETPGHRRARLRDWLILLKTPSYVFNTLGMTAMTFSVGAFGYWMPDYVHQFRGEPDLKRINLIFGLIVVVSGLSATLLGGVLGDRLRGRYSGSYFMVSAVAMFAGFPFTVAMLYTPFPYAWVFAFLACFCLFFNTGPTNTILANVTHPSLRATGFALNILVIHALGDVISPTVVGAIADRYDMNAGFLAVSVMTLVGGVLWLWGARYLKRDTELASTRL